VKPPVLVALGGEGRRPAGMHHVQGVVDLALLEDDVVLEYPPSLKVLPQPMRGGVAKVRSEQLVGCLQDGTLVYLESGVKDEPILAHLEEGRQVFYSVSLRFDNQWHLHGVWVWMWVWVIEGGRWWD